MESIPPIEPLSLVEDIYIKAREASEITDLNMREFSGIDKVLQSIHGELLNNTSKLIEINKHSKRDTKKLEKVENGANEPVVVFSQCSRDTHKTHLPRCFAQYS